MQVDGKGRNVEQKPKKWIEPDKLLILKTVNYKWKKGSEEEGEE